MTRHRGQCTRRASRGDTHLSILVPSDGQLSTSSCIGPAQKEAVFQNCTLVSNSRKAAGRRSGNACRAEQPINISATQVIIFIWANILRIL
ncbi:hypothetical protein AGIG_G360 [Arapaima gigas]